MNNSIFHPDRHRYLAYGWLMVCLLLVAALWALLPRSQINSSVLALLPEQQITGVPSEITQGFTQRLDRQLVWLVSPPPGGDRSAVAWWLQQMQQSPELQHIEGPMDAQRQQQWGKFFFQHRNVLLDDATRQRLSAGGNVQAQWILGQLYSAFAGVSGKELANDPLLLVRGAQLAQQQNSGSLTLEDSWLVAQDKQGRSWYLLHGELKASSYDITQGRKTVDHLNRLQQQMQQRWPGSEVLSRGTIFYSDYASQQAEQDLATIGLASVLGVFILILGMFRSLIPLALCLLSIALGALAGTVATLLAFGEIHVMTLVMSTSIIGISADYTLYFLTERRVHGRQTTPLDSLRKLFPALSMALLTTVIAYLTLLIAPFPGLQQLAVFAAAGLSAACLTVFCWYPYLSARLPVRPAPGLPLLVAWLRAWQQRRMLRFGLPASILAFVIFGFSQLTINDDIGELQALPAGLQKQEQRIADLTGQRSDQKWLVVYGDNENQALQRLEMLQPGLANAKVQGVLGDYRLLNLPSLERQKSNLDLLQLNAHDVVNRLNEAGIAVTRPDISAQWLTPKAWLESEASRGWRLLWLSLPGGKTAVLIPVSGVTHSQAMAELANTVPGVSWVDRKTEFSQLFSQYRHILSALLAFSVAVIGGVALWRFRLPQGFYCLIPTLLSLGMGIAVLGVSGYSLNLFSLLALILVLGIGINYTLFFTNPRGTPTTSLFAVLMAVLTTQLTFGMLVFSSTQAISSFGIVLGSGVFTAFLLAPLTLPVKKGERE